MLYSASGYIDEAIENMNFSVRNHPSLPVLYFQRGVFFQQANKFREAAMDYSEALRVIDTFLLNH